MSEVLLRCGVRARPYLSDFLNNIDWQSHLVKGVFIDILVWRMPQEYQTKPSIYVTEWIQQARRF